MVKLRMPMANLLKFILILIEWGVQLKRRDDEAQKQQRLHHARTNLADYLRQFGRVQRDQPSHSEDSVPRSRASANRNDSQ